MLTRVNPRRLHVPAANPVVDWRQPLARGLIGCWLPGLTLGKDLAGKAPTLTVRANATFGATPEGPAQIAANASGNDGLSGLAPAPYKFTAASGGLSMYWRGVIAGQRLGATDPTLIGLSYDNAGGAPYIVASLGPLQGDVWGKLSIFFNTAGSLSWVSTNSSYVNTFGIMYSFGVTVIPSASAGSIVFYNSGLSGTLGVSTFGAGNPTTSATTTIILGTDPYSIARSPNIRTNLACFWNRVLSPAEMLAQHLNPYGFLVQAAPLFGTRISGQRTSRYYYDMNRSQHV